MHDECGTEVGKIATAAQNHQQQNEMVIKRRQL